jgi:hypothetical protein
MGARRVADRRARDSVRRHHTYSSPFLDRYRGARCESVTRRHDRSADSLRYSFCCALGYTLERSFGHGDRSADRDRLGGTDVFRSQPHGLGESFSLAERSDHQPDRPDGFRAVVSGTAGRH